MKLEREQKRKERIKQKKTERKERKKERKCRQRKNYFISFIIYKHLRPFKMFACASVTSWTAPTHRPSTSPTSKMLLFFIYKQRSMV